MTTPRRYVNGVATREASHPFGQFLEPDPTRVFGYFNDFLQYTAADWVINDQATGSATEVIAEDETGGVLVLLNGTANTDFDNLQLSRDGGTNDSETFLFAVGKKAWFDCRIKSNDGDKVTIHIGLHITNTDPVGTAPTDGVYFKVTTITGDISLHVRKDSVESLESGLATLGDDTFVRLSYYWDGVDTFTAFVNDVAVATIASGNLPDDELLTVSFGVENGEANDNTLELDYIGAWMER